MLLITRHSRLRRALIVAAPAVLVSKLLRAQQPAGPGQLPPELPSPNRDEDARLPNGKKQRDAILKADYEQNVKDAESLVDRAKDFQQELEKSDRYVLSLGLLKELDEIEKLTRRIRGRMKRM